MRSSRAVAHAAGHSHLRCGTDEFAAITGFNLHRGCLALAERPGGSRVDEVVRAPIFCWCSRR